MRVEVHLFAGLRAAAGVPSVTVELPPGATIAALRHALADEAPELAGWLPRVRVALDAAYVTDDAIISSADAEVALIPPVSGG